MSNPQKILLCCAGLTVAFFFTRAQAVAPSASRAPAFSSAATPSPSPVPVAAYSEESWNRWRTQRDAELKDVMKSYLSVVDHAVIKNGESLYLPVGVPHVEVSWRKDSPGKPMVSVTSRDGAVRTLDSTTRATANLLDEPSGWKTPDGMIVTAEGPANAAVLTLRDPNKAGFKDFKATPYFPFNPKAVVHGRFNALAHPEKTTLLTTQYRERPAWLMGTLEFSYDEAPRSTLKAYCLGDKPSIHDLFVPFLDATNGIETYSGGRYVEADADDSGAVTIDFNRAYNPYCARNRIFTCIRVAGKSIEARILAGEKAPATR